MKSPANKSPVGQAARTLTRDNMYSRVPHARGAGAARQRALARAARPPRARLARRARAPAHTHTETRAPPRRLVRLARNLCKH